MSLVDPLKFYLVPMTPEVVFESTIDSVSEPNTINFSGAIATGTVPPLAGMTLRLYQDGFTDDDVNIIGRPAQRVRSVPTGTVTGQIVIGEDDEFFLTAAAGDTVRILNEFRLWPKFPRFVQNGTNVIQYEDYDIEYTDQLSNYRPTAVAGPPAVVWLEGGTATASFVGVNSFALDTTLSTALWTAYGSVEGTSSTFGTEGSPVVFTWNQAGRWLVSLTVTDLKGNSHTAYTYAVVIDPANIDDIAYRDFDAINDKFDWQQGGGTCSFTVEGAAGKGIFADEMRILHVYRGNLTTPTATWPNRANLLFDGWIVGNSIRQNLNNGDVQFRATTIDGVMKRLTMFPTSLTYTSSPSEWTQAANLDVDRVCHYVYHYRSTLASMTPVTRSNYSGLIGRQDFGEQNLFAAVQNGLMRSIWGNLVSSHQSVLYHSIDLMVLESADRTSYGTVRKGINKTIWVGDATIEESHDYSWIANRVKSSGVYYTGGDYDDICPLFSEAPGDAPLAYGSEASFDRLILTGQTELNQRTGYKLAQLKKRIQAIRLQFINDGSFGIVPQDRFGLTIEAGDNDRGVAIPGDRAVARSVTRQYDHNAGIITVDVTFEPETTGNDGVTVIMPCEPPDQKTNTDDNNGLIPLIPLNPPPSDDRPLTAIAAATDASSFYFANGVPVDWERRISGLVGGQVILNDMFRDPWTYILNGGYSPERVIVWGCGTGFVVRSEDSGQNWQTRSGNFPGATWGADAEQAYTGIDFINLVISDFIANDVYVLGRWQSGGLWRSAIYYSFDGFNWSVYTLEGNTEVKGLGLAIDRGNGVTLWVTTWESDDTLYLRRIELPVFTETGKYSMGSATEAELGDTYIAYPSCAWSKTDQVFVFGRMQNPQGLADPAHVIKSDNRGDSWSVVDSTWGADLCDTFASDSEGFYYAVRRTLAPVATTPEKIIDNTPFIDAVALDSDRVAVGYIDGNDGNAAKVVAVDISSGSPVTLGAEITLDNTSSAEIQIALTETGEIVASWRTTSQWKVAAVSFSGLVGTKGATKNVGSPALVSSPGIAAMSATILVAAANNYSNLTSAHVVRISKSGTTLSVGTGVDLTDATDRSDYKTFFGAAPINSTDVIFVCEDDDGATEDGRILQVSNAPALVSDLDSARYNGLADNYGAGVVKMFDNNAAVIHDNATDINLWLVTASGSSLSEGAAATLAGEGNASSASVDRISDDRVVTFYSNKVETATLSGGVFAFDGNDVALTGVNDHQKICVCTVSTYVAIFRSSGAGASTYLSIVVGSFTRFYAGQQSLSELLDLPFTSVNRGAMSLNKPKGRVVIGGATKSTYPIIYSDFPYTQSAAASGGALNPATGTYPFTSVKWL